MVGTVGVWGAEPVVNLDLVARTAADQHATVEIAVLAEQAAQAAQAAQALRETLQRATLAAEALALPAAR